MLIELDSNELLGVCINDTERYLAHMLIKRVAINTQNFQSAAHHKLQERHFLRLLLTADEATPTLKPDPISEEVKP